MSVDKLVDSTQLDADLTSVANAIRTKGGTSASLAFPSGFVSAIGDIPTGGGGISWDDIASSSEPSGLVTLTGTSVAEYAFAYRRGTNTWQVSGASVTTLGQNAFRDSAYLTEARFPNLTSISNIGYIFYNCSRLALIDYGEAALKGNTFVKCSVLKTLILRSTSIQTCSSTSCFNDTPFKSGGSGGTIYIPKVLYDHLGDGTSSDYKAATNWSTYDGYGTITWAQIEGSTYEL